MSQRLDRPDGRPDEGVDSRLGSRPIDADRAPYVVALSGELDLTSRPVALAACTPPGHRDVVVDLSDLSFLDCAGVRALDDAAAILETRGGSLVVVDAVGEPHRLLSLIGGPGRASWFPGRSVDPSVPRTLTVLS